MADPWFGIEQEYQVLDLEGEALGFSGNEVQGPFYCGVGTANVSIRELVEKHTQACLAAELKIAGTNLEVAPSQAEFQIGAAGPLRVSDHLWLARWLLHRLSEDMDVKISFDAKALGQTFNGSGCHTNVSTRYTRYNPNNVDERGGILAPEGTKVGMEAILECCEKLGKRTSEHIAVYGYGVTERLTGQHETCSWTEFRFGIADRGASIRIPRHVANKGCGYFEDRRPCADIDPYVVTATILRTICDLW